MAQVMLVVAKVNSEPKPFNSRENTMTVEEIKKAALELNHDDQKRLIVELVPEIWRVACVDDECLDRLRQLVDEEAVKRYRQEHYDSI